MNDIYVITKKNEFGDFFYQFSTDETDLYCVATDSIRTCKKYSNEDKERLSNSNLLSLRGVKFKKLYFNLKPV